MMRWIRLKRFVTIFMHRLAKLNANNSQVLTREEMIDNFSSRYLKYEKSKALTDAYITQEMKDRTRKICEELRHVFLERIASNTWMGEVTRNNIREKLEAMTFNIGAPDEYITEGLPDISQATDIKELTKMLYAAGYPQNAAIEELVPQVIANSDSYRGNDFSICADARVRIWEGIHAELRYQYSLVPIRTRLFYKDVNETLLKTDDSRVQPLQRQYNNSITLRVVYLFNERRAKANKEASKKGQ